MKDRKELKLDLLSDAELLQQRSDENEFRSKDNIEISAVTRFHSTETTLIKVENDILRALDSHKCVVLLLLDV